MQMTIEQVFLRSSAKLTKQALNLRSAFTAGGDWLDADAKDEHAELMELAMALRALAEDKP